MFPTVGSAVTITSAACTVNPGTCVTGIENLDIGGTFFDVSFDHTGSYNEIYGGGAPIFLGDPTGAAAAADAIRAVIAGASTDGVVANSNSNDYWFVPYNLHGGGDSKPGYVDFMYGFENGGVAHVTSDCAGGAGCLSASTDHSVLLPGFAYNWALIAPVPVPTTFRLLAAPVPEPTTLGMLGAGLLGFGLMRRRRRARTIAH
jgi:hypothetical protein